MSRIFRHFTKFSRLFFRSFKNPSFTRNCGRIPKFFIAQQIVTHSEQQKDVENNLLLEEQLELAFENGEIAVIKLLEELKESLLRTSQEYRVCLEKQIEVTTIATNLGTFSEKWDELPAIRLEAEELLKRLNDLLITFHIIGQLAYDHSLITVLIGNELNVDNIIAKYKELELLILYEIELNKKKKSNF